jgi:hypothetical protein
MLLSVLNVLKKIEINAYVLTDLYDIDTSVWLHALKPSEIVDNADRFQN